MSSLSRPVTLCITAFNEADNVPALAQAIAAILERFPSDLAFSVVDNGSSDETLAVLQAALGDVGESRVGLVRVSPNRLYGGGMLAAIQAAETDYVALMPADSQYSVADICAVVETWSALTRVDPTVMVKGRRADRADPVPIRLLSRVYSALGRVVFGLPRLDVNGLPKVLPRNLFDEFGSRLPRDAVFDAALLFVHRRTGGDIVEVPVTFSARPSGASSWSGRALRTGLRMLRSSISTRRRLTAALRQPRRGATHAP